MNKMKRRILDTDIEILKSRLMNGGIGPRILERGLEELKDLVKSEFYNEPVYRRFERASLKYKELLKFVEEMDETHKLGFVRYTIPCRNEYENLLNSAEVSKMNLLINERKMALTTKPNCQYQGSEEEGIRVVSARSMGLDCL